MRSRQVLAGAGVPPTCAKSKCVTAEFEQPPWIISLASREQIGRVFRVDEFAGEGEKARIDD